MMTTLLPIFCITADRPIPLHILGSHTVPHTLSECCSENALTIDRERASEAGREQGIGKRESV